MSMLKDQLMPHGLVDWRAFRSAAHYRHKLHGGEHWQHVEALVHELGFSTYTEFVDDQRAKNHLEAK